MKYLVLIGVILLSGCQGRVDEWEMNAMVKYCYNDNRGGIDYIDNHWNVSVMCKSGDTYDPNSQKELIEDISKKVK